MKTRGYDSGTIKKKVWAEILKKFLKICQISKHDGPAKRLLLTNKTINKKKNMMDTDTASVELVLEQNPMYL